MRSSPGIFILVGAESKGLQSTTFTYRAPWVHRHKIRRDSIQGKMCIIICQGRQEKSYGQLATTPKAEKDHDPKIPAFHGKENESNGGIKIEKSALLDCGEDTAKEGVYVKEKKKGWGELRGGGGCYLGGGLSIGMKNGEIPSCTGGRGSIHVITEEKGGGGRVKGEEKIECWDQDGGGGGGEISFGMKQKQNGRGVLDERT